jgi:hypothetical protein
MGGIIALYFDGATCTFHELPPPDNKEAMKQVYKFLENRDKSTEKSLSLFIHSFIKKLFNG